MTRTTARLTRRATPARVTATRCRVERLESRQLLSTSPIDPTFAAREQGVAFTTYAADVAVRDDGKVLVAESRQVGDVRRMAVTRYNADGSLDTTFGTGGRAYADFGGTSASAEAMDVTADGHVVVAGGSGGDYALARFNPNGTPDASFGGDGTDRSRSAPSWPWARSPRCCSAGASSAAELTTASRRPRCTGRLVRCCAT